MEENELIELIADKSCRFLRDDDINPDVGWGMTYNTAVELAVEEIKVEVARWNSMLALQLDISDEMRKKSKDIISQRRGGR